MPMVTAMILGIQLVSEWFGNQAFKFEAAL
jgi:hypothetical protein